MGILSFALNGNYNRFYKNLKNIGKKNHKSAFLMFIDASVCTILFGSGLTDYLNYKFYEKSLKKKSEYVTIGYQSKFYKKAAYTDEGKILSNKTEFHRHFKEYTQRDYCDPSDGKDKVEEFINNHKTFVVKPINGLGGEEVEKINKEDIENIDEFYNYLINKKLFLEELIIQNKEWSKISPNSVNTIRVVTTCVNDDAKIIFMVARIGSGKSIVDNFHQGGFAVNVSENGVLIGKGISKDLGEYTVHPITNVKIKGFNIPYFNEIKTMCLDLAKKNNKVHIIGWDVAITEHGPVIIEGNSGPGFDIVQVMMNCGAKYMLKDLKRQMKKEKIW